MQKEEKLESYETMKFKWKDIIKKFVSCIREYKKYTILAISFIILETLLECTIPFVMSKLIDIMGEITADVQIALNNVLIYSAILFILAVLSFTCGILAGRFSAKASVGFSKNVRKDLFNKTTTFSFNNIDKFSISSLVTRQTTDIYYIQMSFMMIIRIGLRAPLMLIFGVVMATIMAPTMAWVYAITIPFLAAALLTVLWFVSPMFIRLFKKYDKLNESIEENVRGIRVIKTYVREEHEKNKFSKASEDIRNGFVKAERLIALSHPLMYLSMYLSMSLIIFIGSWVILNTSSVVVDTNTGDVIIKYIDLSVGQLSALITYGAQILSSLMMLSMIFFMITMSLASMKRVYEVLIEESTIVIKNENERVNAVSSGDIEFKNVSFKYKETAKRYALSNVNIKIKEGQMIGIVGGTGSSKSTFVNLISRFYDVSEGELLVGGVNVKDYDVYALRQQVSMVLQKNILFSGTIKENLRWGNKFATDEEIKDACKIAQADSFIESFPMKYDYQILQGGTNVSGGQKQRLCIARAILKNPKVLILDDSTSAVDTKTDALIRKGLRTTLPNTTKIIIAQRVSSVQDADFIIVMNEGMVDGVGTHEELLKNNKIYKEIYDIQNQIGGLEQ